MNVKNILTEVKITHFYNIEKIVSFKSSKNYFKGEMK